jgi:hypothetical protein
MLLGQCENGTYLAADELKITETIHRKHFLNWTVFSFATTAASISEDRFAFS